MSGESWFLVDALPSTNLTYEAAKEILTQAFSSRTTQWFNETQCSTSLKFSWDSPFKYVSKMKRVTHAMKTLNMNLDDVQQYFVWKSFSWDLKNILVQITNSEDPTINEIESNIFKALRRHKYTTNDSNQQNRSK